MSRVKEYRVIVCTGKATAGLVADVVKAFFDTLISKYDAKLDLKEVKVKIVEEGSNVKADVVIQVPRSWGEDQVYHYISRLAYIADDTLYDGLNPRESRNP